MKENEGVDRGWRGGCETEICTNLRLLVMSGDKLLATRGRERSVRGKETRETGRERKKDTEDGNERRERWKNVGGEREGLLGGWVRL